MFLRRWSGEIRIASGDILQLAGVPFRRAASPGIGRQASEFLDQSALDPMADAPDALGVYPNQLIASRAGRILRIAKHALGAPIRREHRVPNRDPEALHDRSLDLTPNAFDALVRVHVPLLSCVWDGLCRASNTPRLKGLTASEATRLFSRRRKTSFSHEGRLARSLSDPRG